jgi:glycosyltransferase involved in cell wall biosynthesis
VSYEHREMPALSVVIPSVSGLQDLTGCLQALFAHTQQIGVEVLVADRCGEIVRREVARQFPRARVLAASAGTSIPDLRAMAFDEARGDSVAVIEDHVLVPEGWAEQLLRAQSRGEDVVGGSVDNAATDRLVDWAAFYCEYSHLLPPIAAGPATRLTGNNTVYRRTLLGRYRALTRAGVWEDQLHDAFRRDGVILTCRPEIQVGHKKHCTVRGYSRERFLYARSYAGARLRNARPASRILYGAAAFALPPVLLGRIALRVLVKPGHRLRMLQALPLVAVFVCAWAVGEIVGAWAGPGDSLSRVC